jgi:hypothetical protein
MFIGAMRSVFIAMNFPLFFFFSPVFDSVLVNDEMMITMLDLSNMTYEVSRIIL